MKGGSAAMQEHEELQQKAEREIIDFHRAHEIYRNNNNEHGYTFVHVN